jgi:hypothetical protein
MDTPCNSKDQSTGLARQVIGRKLCDTARLLTGTYSSFNARDITSATRHQASPHGPWSPGSRLEPADDGPGHVGVRDVPFDDHPEAGAGPAFLQQGVSRRARPLICPQRSSPPSSVKDGFASSGWRPPGRWQGYPSPRASVHAQKLVLLLYLLAVRDVVSNSDDPRRMLRSSRTISPLRASRRTSRSSCRRMRYSA